MSMGRQFHNCKKISALLNDRKDSTYENLFRYPVDAIFITNWNSLQAGLCLHPDYTANRLSSYHYSPKMFAHYYLIITCKQFHWLTGIYRQINMHLGINLQTGFEALTCHQQVQVRLVIPMSVWFKVWEFFHHAYYGTIAMSLISRGSLFTRCICQIFLVTQS